MDVESTEPPLPTEARSTPTSMTIDVTESSTLRNANMQTGESAPLTDMDVELPEPLRPIDPRWSSEPEESTGSSIPMSNVDVKSIGSRVPTVTNSSTMPQTRHPL